MASFTHFQTLLLPYRSGCGPERTETTGQRKSEAGVILTRHSVARLPHLYLQSCPKDGMVLEK